MAIPWTATHSWLASSTAIPQLEAESDAVKATTEWQQLRAAAGGFADFGFFAERFFPHHCKAGFCPMHHEFFDLMRNPLARGQRLAIAAPRGYGKTTLFVLIKILHAICYHTEPYIIVACQSKEEAKERVSQVAQELSHNPFLKAVFGTLLVKGRTNRQIDKFITTTDIKVEGVSIGTQIRGKKHRNHRPTYIILDDVEKLANTYNPEARTKLDHWFQKDVMKCIETDGTSNVAIIGTVMHVDSLLAKLLVNAEWTSRRYQAILHEATHTELWAQWKDLLMDTPNPDRQANADAFYTAHQSILLEGSQVLWAEQEPYKRLMEQRLFGGEGAFRSEKQNDPYDPARQLFHMDVAERFTLEGNIVVVGNHRIPLNTFRVAAYLDPCMGNDPGRLTGDYAAIAVVGRNAEGLYLLLECYLEKSPPDEQIEAAYRLRQRWGFTSFAVESNGQQGLLTPRFRDYARNHVVSPLNIVEVVNKRPKLERIAALQPLVHNGSLRFNATLPQTLMSQFAQYPSTYDDGPDAVAGAISQFEQHHPVTTVLVNTQTAGTPKAPRGYPLSNKATRPQKR